MGRKYPEARKGEWIAPVRKGYRLACCDCGLVHRINFRLVKLKGGGHKIQFQAFRDNRSTAQMRRHAREKKKG